MKKIAIIGYGAIAQYVFNTLKKLKGTIMKLVTVLIWSNLSAYNPTIIPNDPMNSPPKNK